MEQTTKHIHLFESWRAHKEELILEGAMKHVMELARDAKSFDEFKAEVSKFLEKKHGEGQGDTSSMEDSLRKTYDQVKKSGVGGEDDDDNLDEPTED